ncbi:uncharacterized protein LOC130673908 [Microplitis mediator]|uniref:uncharacterized protein LOC130673908 n=1 Tax=Microplitis mediator TaxID=375433 RepID=UPI002553A14F|nr:uncharacterized protein LOC130673908 [Microplitis mediator]
MSHYIEYYNNQAEGGHIEKYNRFGKVYVGSYQHGHGIGAFLGGLFRRVVPFLGKAACAIGKEALHAGANVLSDFTAGQIPLKQSLEHRLTESGLRLKRKASEKLDEIMRSSGYKRKHIRKITPKATRSAKIVQPNGKVDEKDFVGPVNNFLHSMFNQVDVFFNQKMISPPNNAYAYRAYMETLLNYGVDAKKSHLKMSLWSMDTRDHMDAVVAQKNTALDERIAYSSKGKEFELMGHLHCDFFNQDKFLLNGVEMRIRLIRSKNAFCLMDESANNYIVKISEAMLVVRRVKISPSILIAHARTLGQTTAKYPLTKVEVKSFVLSQGILGNTIDDVVVANLARFASALEVNMNCVVYSEFDNILQIDSSRQVIVDYN